jgi:hypothetical protein
LREGVPETAPVSSPLDCSIKAASSPTSKVKTSLDSISVSLSCSCSSPNLSRSEFGDSHEVEGATGDRVGIITTSYTFNYKQGNILKKASNTQSDLYNNKNY